MRFCINSCRARCQQQLRTTPIHPKYYVLSIIYAPPGCTSTAGGFQCPARGSVTYTAGTTTGTTSSVSNSFTSGTSVSTDRSLSFFGVNIDFTDTSSIATSTEQRDSLTVSRREEGSTITEGVRDGIDHGQDLFILLLNPVVLVQSLGRLTSVDWNLGIGGPSALTLPVSVSELRNPNTMPAPVAAEFQRRGFTAADFQSILALNPFANGGTTIDPARYARTTESMPYRAPVLGGSCTVTTKRISNDLLREHTASSTMSYTTSLLTRIELLRLSQQDSFTFTSSSSMSSRAGSSSSAFAVIPCPSPAFTGSPLMDVYWDTVYQSFLFAPNNDPIAHEGRILDQSGRPVAHEEVALTIDGETHYTVTDNDGRYVFAAPASEIRSGSERTGRLVTRTTRETVNLRTPSTVRMQIE